MTDQWNRAGLPAVDNTWPWPEPDVQGYVSAPQSKYETAVVRCSVCGGRADMPMDGPAPVDDKGDIDWDRLLPIMLRFQKTILAPSCRYNELMRHG